MSLLRESLGPRLLGAELLARIGRERRDGVLTWEGDGKPRQICFKAGRPEAVIEAHAGECTDKAAVLAQVRALAATCAGVCTLEPLARDLPAKLSIDTLGECLLGVARGMKEHDVAGVIAARHGERLEPTASFAKLAPVVAGLVGETLGPPTTGLSLGALLEGASAGQQRGVLALLALGGLRANEPATNGNAAPLAPPVGAVSAASVRDDATRVAIEEVQRVHARLAGMSHYELLGVVEGASTDEIREAYFKVAKRWHSDRFSGVDLGRDFMAMVEEIFARATEAQRVLSDPEQRKTYDFIRERKAKGLPTDVNVILEAEELFHKAQVLVRRGQAAAAEPMLRQAVALNKGEAEFWVYFGFAVHAAHGKSGVSEARAAIKRGLEMNPKLDMAHEFLGRIARIEGEMSEAQRELKAAIEMNPRNRDAERELRLIQMRAAKEADEGKGLSGLLGGLLKKK